MPLLSLGLVPILLNEMKFQTLQGAQPWEACSIQVVVIPHALPLGTWYLFPDPLKREHVFLITFQLSLPQV